MAKKTARTKRNAGDDTETLLKKILITQLRIAGVGQKEISKIVGISIGSVFDSPASVFFVQYEGEVKESVYKLMEELAKAKAILGGEIFWGVIDDDGTKKLRKAYPRAYTQRAVWRGPKTPRATRHASSFDPQV
jgi:hypothetical protein